MDIDLNFEISIMDELKFEVGVLVPVLKELRKEFGEERVNRIALEALRERMREFYRRFAETLPGSPREKYETLGKINGPRIGNDVDFQPIKSEPGLQEVNITGCRFADYMRKIGEPELGHALLCYGDDCIAAVAWPEIKFTRTQTIMEGANYCDFRYKINFDQKQ
jgi:hypothetical protein